jgi:hypothetical protein
MEAENTQRALQHILEDLLKSTSASRTTIRLDVPIKDLHLDTQASAAWPTAQGGQLTKLLPHK